jgi:hypothetical protein
VDRRSRPRRVRHRGHRRRSDPGEERPAAIEPTAPTQREPVLDVLRAIALLGILLINIEYLRAAGFYDAFVGEATPATTQADRIVQFGMGWLAAGKFLSMFAILFGVGAAMIAERAVRAGRSPRRLLARRYGLLVGLGPRAHGAAVPRRHPVPLRARGPRAAPFVRLRPKTALRWASGSSS